MASALGHQTPTAAAPAARDERDVAAVEAIMRRGGPRLAGRMSRCESHLEQVTAELGAPLAAYATATVRAGGKRLRPLLVLLAAEADEEEPARPSERESQLVRAATAVELLHSATLVHDDVIDGASLRRGHPTVAVVAGRRAATATGDLLFSRAFAELARNGDLAQLEALSDASSALAAGELLQREDAFSPSVSVERYLARCEMKTAALFEAACRLGALVVTRGERSGGTAGTAGEIPGGASQQAPFQPRNGAGGGLGALAQALADALGTFARRIGLAFQVLDDVLDVSGAAADTGKARGKDLLDGTVTLPLILARKRDRELAAVDLRMLRHGGEAEALCERITATGALAQARALALELVVEAKGGLPDGLPSRLRALLDLVADAVVERYR